jgi:molybdopterin-containing oxidoreductase family membrane subunit
LKKELAMPLERYIMGLFKDEDQVVAAINELKQSSYTFIRVNIPFPSHKIMDALKLKKSMVGWFTLGGGIFGFLGGFVLAIYTATQWNLIVSGKPIVAIIPFVVVGFEATILCAVFGNILGLLTQGRLPSYKGLKYYDPRCSGEHFGILASCAAEQEDGLKNFFRQQGGEVRVFE